jgi:hypothetical protein
MTVWHRYGITLLKETNKKDSLYNRKRFRGVPLASFHVQCDESIVYKYRKDRNTSGEQLKMERYGDDKCFYLDSSEFNAWTGIRVHYHSCDEKYKDKEKDILRNYFVDNEANIVGSFPNDDIFQTKDKDAFPNIFYWFVNGTWYDVCIMYITLRTKYIETLRRFQLWVTPYTIDYDYFSSLVPSADFHLKFEFEGPFKYAEFDEALRFRPKTTQNSMYLSETFICENRAYHDIDSTIVVPEVMRNNILTVFRLRFENMMANFEHNADSTFDFCLLELIPGYFILNKQDKYYMATSKNPVAQSFNPPARS